MDWQTIFTGACAAIVAAYGLYKGIQEIKASSKTGLKKREEEITAEKTQRMSEIIEAVKPMIDKLESKLDKHIQDNEIQNRKYNDDITENKRVRILHNRDDLQNKYIPWPSESAFEQMLKDCDDYERYLQKNPDFPNSIGADAILIIKEAYKIAKKDNLFSREKEQ